LRWGTPASASASLRLGRKEDQAPYGAGPEPERLRLEAVEYAMAVRISAAVQRLQGSVDYAESCPSTIGPITPKVKQTGERSAGNPHAAFDVAGAGNAARSRYCDTRRRKGEPTVEHKHRPKQARQSSTLPMVVWVLGIVAVPLGLTARGGEL